VPGSAAELQVLPRHIPRAAAGLTPVGTVDTDRRLNLALGLPLRNREILTNLLAELYDPSSPKYRHFLSAQQFAEQFGPSEQEYASLVAFAHSNHFVVTRTHGNRMLLDVNAASGDIGHALHLKLRLYPHPTEARRFYAPDAEPTVDSRIPLLSISGLDDFHPPRPANLKARLMMKGAAPKSAGTPQPNLVATGSGPEGTFFGRDFRNAYAPGVPLDGAGESVGLVEFDNYYPNDIKEYEDLAGLPHVTLTNALVDGVNRAPGLNNGEVALDIEMAVAMAPGLSKVIVYEGTSGNDILNRMATDNLARQLSCSWAFGPQVDATREQILQQFAAQGQSFFVASGDDGAFGTVGPPADDPFVTSVGGTSLVTSTPSGAWVSESAWFDSGGGISPNYPIPAWQKGINMAANQGSTTLRNVPDVAALADNVIWSIANNGQQGSVAGTSAAAPLWAGFAALANQQARAGYQPPIGFLNPALYAIGQSAAFAGCFHDVTTGNNTTAASPNKFFAVSGYDLCTGWGTPSGSNLISALLAPPDALQVSPGLGFVFTGPAGGPFNPVSEVYTLTNTGSSVLSWAVSVPANWLSALPSSGFLTPGVAATPVTLSLNSAASLLAPGTHSADVWFTNLNDGFVQSRTVTLAVVTAPVILVQPTNQTVPVGATVQLAVGTTPNASLSFQWRTNGTDLTDGNNVSGAQSNVLTLLNVTPNANATYSVRISNAAGLTNSAGAVLMVTSSPPVIMSQPLGQSVLPGAEAAFSVVAYGDAPLSYQWRMGGTDLTDGGNLSGSRSSTLRLANVSAADANTYSVVVSNTLGFRFSAEAILNVAMLTTPELVQQTIYSFTGAAGGGHPNGLTRGLNGTLFGTTQAGGVDGSGTVFFIDTNGVPQTLYSFTGTNDGKHPNGDLLQQANGALLGTTFGGGSNGFGTIFRLETNNLLTKLFDFDHTNGVLPTAGLTKTADGSPYGTSYEGGIFHFGTLFRLDTNGAYSVQVPFDSTNGAFPHCKLTLGSDGQLYGTTYKGGRFGSGTVFTMTPGGPLTTLASFDGTNGAFPMASLSQGTDGSFCGVTSSGGTFGLGTVFRVTRAGVLSNVYSFAGPVDGSHPQATPLLSSDGNFYGTTSDGGTFGLGTIFRLTPGGALTTIAQFDGFNGANPEAPLTEAEDGSLYGMTQNGGPNNQGVIFRLRVPAFAPQLTSEPAPVTAYVGSSIQFNVASFGSSPLAYQWQVNGTNLVDGARIVGSQGRILTLNDVGLSDSAFYSVVVSNAFGSVPSAAARLQVLSSAPVITLQPTNQTVVPGTSVILSAAVGGNLPLSYQWQVNGTNVLESGNVAGARTPTLIITRATEGNGGNYVLIATNALGTAQTTNAILTVVPVTAPGTLLSTLYAFTGNVDGRKPSQLVAGGDGFLYGTTPLGGTYRQGTIFKVGTNGGFVSVLSFDGTNGALPRAGLVLGSNGLFYGTTSAGGTLGAGTSFSFAPSAALTNLYIFSGAADGSAPQVALAEGPDGSFYGATSSDGQNGWGTIFRVDPAGHLATMHSFSGGVDGTGPADALLASDGADFYGLTSSGGAFTNGSVFRLSSAGLFTNIYSFSGGSDGLVPVGSLVRGDNGALYGATRFNTIRGFEFYGTLFTVTTNGAFRTLYSLNFSDGSYPAAGLVLANDGNFYGTTEQGGANNYGTVFRMTPDGVFSTLLEFDGFNDGANPITALTQGADGNLYGTTSSGGPGGFGTVFRLGFSGPPVITAQPLAQVASTGGSVSFSVAMSGASPLSYQWQKNGTNLSDGANIKGSSARVLTLSNLTLVDAGAYSVVATNSSGTASSTGAQLAVQVSPPLLRASLQTNGQILITWNTASNRIYQLQTRNALTSGGWQSAGTPLTATADALSVSLPVVPGSPQFYRVVLLP